MINTQTSQIFKTGDIIMKQGDVGDCAYIIEKGKVEILVQGDDGIEKQVGTRSAGAMIGEMALIDKAPRTATIRAIEDCEFIAISAEDFVRRLEKSDPILKMAIRVILARYRDIWQKFSGNQGQQERATAESIEQGYTADSQAINKVKLANELKGAFEREELFLCYQPIIDLEKGTPAGFEALMRWNHPERGFISPGVFIPVAEEIGFIHQLSIWALEESCKALKRIEDELKIEEKLFMSVNFSGDDFVSENFAEKAKGIVSTAGILPSQIHVEITERVLAAEPDLTRDVLQACADNGMHISIDDFGTGYSSLSYLHQFPIKTLKIDRSFVVEMLKEQGSLALIQSIISLGKNMGMSIIAEGVEEDSEVDALKQSGCDMIQGFFFSKPLPESDALAYVKKQFGK